MFSDRRGKANHSVAGVAGIAAKQIRKIMEDLRGEVANIRAGARTLAPLWARRGA